MTASTGLQHVHVLHRGPDDLVDRVAADASAGIESGEAVLVCLPPPEWDLVARRLGPVASQVTYQPGADRYARPVAAMSVLADFVDGALTEGRPGVRSIGAIPYTGTRADSAWVRYEAAVNAVFRDVPLRAVCLADAERTPAAALDALVHVHDDDDGRPPPLEAQLRYLRTLPTTAAVPTGAADVDLTGHVTPGMVRRATAAVLVGELDEDELADVNLVVSELVANAQLYASGCRRARVWLDGTHVTAAVSDDGGGPDDVAAGLRPAGLALGGRGLWIVHQLCESVDFETTASGHTVLARYRRR